MVQYDDTSVLAAYNDGRTDGRMFAYAHNAQERAAELEKMEERRRDARTWVERRYHDGYAEILENWIDGIGA